MNSLIESFRQQILVVTIEGIGRSKESEHTARHSMAKSDTLL